MSPYQRSTSPATLAAALVLLAGCASTTPQIQQVPASRQATAPSAQAPIAGATAATAPPNRVAATAAPLASAVYFDFDSTAIKDQYAQVIRAQATFEQKATSRIELQGNADERGSREYNMALGQKRAAVTKQALVVLGVKTERIDTISYGEERPKAKGHDDAAWAENRRVDFVSK